jgi:DNA-binding beta-propeller fold protein YncE
MFPFPQVAVMPRSFRALSAVVALAAAIPSLALAQSGYHVTKRINTAGEGGWDYLSVDTVGHRLYLSRGTHVQVVDLDRDSLVGDIPNTPGVHGITFAPSLGRGFTSNGRDTSVTIFDLRTLAPIKVVKVTGLNPDAILYDDASGRVFALNHTGANVTAIDAATGAVVGTVPLSGTAETGQSDGKGTIFVNVEDKNVIDAFDAKTLAVKSHIQLPGCDEPTGMGIDRAKGRLWVGCGGNKTMAIVDYRAGKLVATVPVGDGVDASDFDPATGLAFASAGDGTLAVVREDAPNHFVVETVPTARGARTMALDPRTHRVYLSSAQYGPTPAPTPERPRPRAPMIPGSFTILVLDR